jgi:tRNA threonylcarbamoyladenosine biosynthesis protein TsaB
MTILCIETSTQVCSAAICRDGVCVEQRISREGGNHAGLLPVFIDELLQGANKRGERIEAVALSEGPGSYTGLRIGTSTAKGLCYGLNVPLIPVPTLDVLCAAAREQSKITNQKSAILVPMIDARRMEVYTTVKVRSGLMNDANDANDGRARAVVVENEESLKANSQQPTANSQIYYFGDGAAKCQSVLANPNWHYIPDIVPEARFVGLLAEQAQIKNQKSQITNQKSQITNQKSQITNQDLAYYEPYYLKEFIAAPSHVKGLN